MRPAFYNVMSSLGQFIKYGCVIHCTFEYLGDFVVVSTIFYQYFSKMITLFF